ncbi:ATP-binding protein [Streptomyces spinosus]|uniref:ATP-binding protein n=1 Tax=Streptomyces spinosus TaxID=2872623 RepID=UPI001CECE972|nr:ATP-binding protein [Streptomyces spinosus]
MSSGTGGGDRPVDAPLRASAAYDGSTAGIAHARELARSFLGQVRSVHGRRVSEHASHAVQLVVSELVTNAFKYAPGPCLLDIELAEGRIRITVRDTAPELPVIRAPEPGRVGQHGLEIVRALSQSFEVHQEPAGKRTVATVILADGPADTAADQRS